MANETKPLEPDAIWDGKGRLVYLKLGSPKPTVTSVRYYTSIEDVERGFGRSIPLDEALRSVHNMVTSGRIIFNGAIYRNPHA